MKYIMGLILLSLVLLNIELISSIYEKQKDSAYTFEVDGANKMCVVAVDGERSSMSCWDVEVPK